jgi:hypothetical protein
MSAELNVPSELSGAQQSSADIGGVRWSLVELGGAQRSSAELSGSWSSSSGFRGRRRTYHTILKLADHALFKIARYPLVTSRKTPTLESVLGGKKCTKWSFS